MGVSVRYGCFCAHLLVPQLLGGSEELNNSRMDSMQGGVDFDSLGVEGAARAAFSFYNTPADADKGLAAIREAAKDIK